MDGRLFDDEFLMDYEREVELLFCVLFILFVDDVNESWDDYVSFVEGVAAFLGQSQVDQQLRRDLFDLILLNEHVVIGALALSHC